MVDATKATEGKYITAELVEKAEKKSLIITGAGEYEKTEYGERLVLPCEIDKKPKIWNISKDSACNLVSAFGNDTIQWVGKPVKLSIITVMGKKSVLGQAI